MSFVIVFDQLDELMLWYIVVRSHELLISEVKLGEMHFRILRFEIMMFGEFWNIGVCL